MDSFEDNIKIVDGDRKTLLKAKVFRLKRKLRDFTEDIKFRIAIILNGFKF